MNTIALQLLISDEIERKKQRIRDAYAGSLGLEDNSNDRTNLALTHIRDASKQLSALQSMYHHPDTATFKYTNFYGYVNGEPVSNYEMMEETRAVEWLNQKEPIQKDGDLIVPTCSVTLVSADHPDEPIIVGYMKDYGSQVLFERSLYHNYWHFVNVNVTIEEN